MRFSVIVSVYNVKKYIDECLESIARQSFSDFEVILVDDGSTDGSDEICDAYKAKYPALFTVFHNENRGLMLSRRFGIQHAKGDIFVFVDPDDYVDTNLLESVDYVFQTEFPDMVIYGFYRFVDGNEKKKTVIHLPYKNGHTIYADEDLLEFRKKFILEHSCTNMWQKAVRRSIVDIDQDYTQWRANRCEDVIQSLPLLEQAERISFLDKPLYYYRKNDAAMTATERPENLRDYVLCTERSLYYLNRWFQDEMIEQFYRARQNLYYYNYLRNVYKRIYKTPGAKSVMCELVENVFAQEVIRDIICDGSNLVPLLPRRVRLRIRLFDFFMKWQAWMWVCALIWCNTLVEKR